MSIIRILPEQLANRIAAGEVVERPASVVKELLENSLDAGADRIEVEIDGGGIRLIRIVDNGNGMDEDDVMLCLERHGTSKIKSDDDLNGISTLGFRGEAIPSIASVSRMTLTSRQRKTPLGTRVVVDYGKLIKAHETGTSYGTIIEVRNLFGNTPARRKFLKTHRTEIGHIEEIIKNYGLGNPGVSFLLKVNNKETLHLHSSQGVQQKLAAVTHYKGDFLQINHSSEESNHLYSVSGFLVPPEAHTSGAARLRVFVNGRAIKERMIIHAAAEGMRGFLLKGKSPAGFLQLDIPATEVDVNVHPAKNEVRFRHTPKIHELIRQGVENSMIAYQQDIKNQIFTVPDVPVSTNHKTIPPSDTAATVNDSSQRSRPRENQTFTDYSAKDITPTPPAAYASQLDENQLTVTTSETKEQKLLRPPPSPLPEEPKAHDFKIIGQLQNLYIFCQNKDTLVVIDQHAAHERLLFEDLKTQFYQQGVASQGLLFPLTLELTVRQAQTAEEQSEEIAKMGFDLQEFGGSSYLLHAAPALAGSLDPASLLLDLLNQFSGEEERSENRLDDILASMACKAAVKAGFELQHAEIESLINKMLKARLFSHCPHGRPVVKYFPVQDIKKWFHRT